MSEEKRTLTDTLEPFVELFKQYLEELNTFMAEFDAYLKTVPDEEFSPERLDVFIERLVTAMQDVIPEKGPLAEIRPLIPELVRSNFLMGARYARTKRRETGIA